MRLGREERAVGFDEDTIQRGGGGDGAQFVRFAISERPGEAEVEAGRQRAFSDRPASLKTSGGRRGAPLNPPTGDAAHASVTAIIIRCFTVVNDDG